MPANRFEIMECRAALDAVAEAAQDTPEARIGALDVLAQHVARHGLRGRVRPDDSTREVTSAAPYAGLTRDDFDRMVVVRRDGRLRAEDL